MPRPVERVIEAFGRLPGIGPKSAARLTYYLLRAPQAESRELAEALARMQAETAFCSVCFNITEAGVDPCRICRDETREAAMLCVVEDLLDVVALERTGQFRGRYHVLHGAISPVEGIGPDDLRILELAGRVGPEGIREVILATNPTLEGEATALYIRRQLEGQPVRVTRLARGLPSGGDLEYADVTTLSRALEGRQEM
ncbi:MAG: recombination protein RecR [Chloroflexi bacterium RBG_13_68_17]|nr:MAG: recombination protein RecR [Chloroflexi bacterium RBG_13_68_17]